MVSVDDLVISLRIEDTGNLGKLQKQLTALVGEKGEKAVQLGAGMDINLKRDIDIIKGRLEYMTHIAPGLDPQKLALSASALYKTLTDPQMVKNILGKLNVNEVWLKDIQEILIGISTGTSEMTSPKINALVVLLEKAITQSPSAIGDVRGLVTDITEAISEFIRQRQLQEIFKDFGDSVREYYIAMGKSPKEVEEILEKDKGLKSFVEAQEALVGTEEINRLVDMILELKDPLTVLAEFKDVDIVGLTKLPDELEPLAAAYIIAMQQQQLSVIDVMREYFQNIKKGSKGITQKLDSSSLDFLMTVETWEAVLDEFKDLGLTKIGGKNISELAKYVGIELEKGATAEYIREMKYRLEQFDNTIMLFLKTNTNLDKHIDTLTKTAEKNESNYNAFALDLPEMRELAGKSATSEELQEAYEKHNEKIDESFAKAAEEEKQVDGNTVEGLRALVEGMEELTGGKGAEDITGIHIPKGFSDNLDDALDKLDKIDATTKDIDKKVGKEDLTKIDITKDPADET